MADASAFYPDVLVETAGCSEPLIDRSVIRSIIRFSEMTLCHKTMAVSQQASLNTLDYNLTLTETQCRVVRIMEAFYGKRRMLPMPEDEIALAGLYNPSISVETGMPHVYFSKEHGKITVYPKPVKATDLDTLLVRVAIAPTMDATAFDARFSNQYYEGILHGSLFMLLSIPNKPWTDPRTAKYHELEFMRHVNRVKNDQALGNVRSDRQVRFVKV